jgi:hypothetical protein
MEAGPPKMIEAVVRVLVPPASREHVLGDLRERYVSPGRYVIDALRTVPFVVASRIRRTVNVAGMSFLTFATWFGFFHGSLQKSWLNAAIPTAAVIGTFVLRDAYRTLTPTWPRQAAIDIAIAALCTLIAEVLAWLMAPELVLSKSALLIGAPLGCVLLFFARWQNPTGVHQPPSHARALSLSALTAEITIYEATIRRAVRIEMGAGIAAAAIFAMFLGSVRGPIATAGIVLTICGVLFVVWFMHRHASVRPLPRDLGFEATLARYRDDLARRARIARYFALWYVLPLAVGPTVLMVDMGLRRPNPASSIALSVVVIVLAGALLAQAGRGAVDKMQRRLDELARVADQQ